MTLSRSPLTHKRPSPARATAVAIAAAMVAGLSYPPSPPQLPPLLAMWAASPRNRLGPRRLHRPLEFPG